MSLTGKDLAVVAKKHPVGVGCALLSILLLVVLYLRAGKIEETQTRLDEATAMADRLKSNINYSAQLTGQVDTLTQAVESLKASSLNPGALAQNLRYFYQLEADAGVTLIDLRQLNPVYPPAPKNAPKATFVSLPFSVGVQGEFEKVMTFLRKLENGTHLGQINSATLRPSNPRTNVTLTISVELLAQP
ncbi:MAG: hypothetical protein ABII82_18040 [Verrucomicrobiota bacterium]